MGTQDPPQPEVSVASPPAESGREAGVASGAAVVPRKRGHVGFAAEAPKVSQSASAEVPEVESAPPVPPGIFMSTVKESAFIMLDMGTQDPPQPAVPVASPLAESGHEAGAVPVVPPGFFMSTVKDSADIMFDIESDLEEPTQPTHHAVSTSRESARPHVVFTTSDPEPLMDASGSAVIEPEPEEQAPTVPDGFLTGTVKQSADILLNTAPSSVANNSAEFLQVEALEPSRSEEVLEAPKPSAKRTKEVPKVTVRRLSDKKPSSTAGSSTAGRGSPSSRSRGRVAFSADANDSRERDAAPGQLRKQSSTDRVSGAGRASAEAKSRVRKTSSPSSAVAGPASSPARSSREGGTTGARARPARSPSGKLPISGTSSATAATSAQAPSARILESEVQEVTSAAHPPSSVSDMVEAVPVPPGVFMGTVKASADILFAEEEDD